MRNLVLTGLVLSSLISSSHLEAHCQMPCGIYHDQMIYDKIDEYYLTMVKGTSALENNKFQTAEERNQFVRWVMAKEEQSDEVASILMKYFLQQKIRPGDEDSFDLVKSAHRLMFLLVQIKQNVDVKIVREFGKEWDHFKELFHPEMECRQLMSIDAKTTELPPPQKPKPKEGGEKEHDHNHDLHDHDHTH